MFKSFALLVPMIALALPGCGEVKQQQPPRVADDDVMGEGAGSDIAAEPTAVAPVEDSGPAETEEQKKAKCCQQCVDGIPDDKSGDPPGAIPCTKLTTKMDARCVVYFDKHPTTGGEAQKCTAAPSEGEAADGEGDGASLD